MYEGVITHGALPHPWSFNNYPPSVTSNMATTTIELRAGCECDIINIGSHNIDIDAEDFFIGDLSEFANEEIAAPIRNTALSLDHSSLQRQELLSDDNTSASHCKAPSAINSGTSTSGSALLHGSPAPPLNYKSPLRLDMDSSLPLPRQDETGFEWLASIVDDNLIYGASNFGMDSFLLSNAEPFVGGYDGLPMKHGGCDDDCKMKDVKEGHTIKFGASINDEQGRAGAGAGAGGGDHFRWDEENGVKDFDAMMFMPHSTGSRSARSKRARSAGWSSSNILCNNWEENSPTNSLNSTSQICMPNPAYSNPTFLPKQQENDEQHRYATTRPTVELITSSFHAPNSDKSLGKASKFCSNDRNNQAPPSTWRKDDENTKEESVSNYGGFQPRRCTHCLSQKTPQWRAGPEGPKTLCNACGVRYKSGRLYDEYRPAKSPTFLSYKHSNSHKKVMEMRRRKTLQYNPNSNHNPHQHHHHHHPAHAAHHTRTPPPALKHASEVAPDHVGNRLKIKFHPSTLEPHSHFSDVTLISTRTALESPSSFLY